VAKFVVLGFVAMGIALTYAVGRLHGWTAPKAVAGLTGLLPISLICGAAVLSEWPYLALSMAFLWALARLMESRAWRWAVMVGVLLAMASLTRFIGVFLGVAIVVQAWHLFRKAGWRAVVPEAVASVLGAGVWLLWKLRCNAVIATGDAPSGAYDDLSYYLGRFSHIEPLELLSKIETVLFSAGKVGDKLLGGSWSGLVAGLVVGVLVVTGLVLRIRRSGLAPADAYVIVCLLLLLGDLNKPERYFVPLAPFLIGYFVTVISAAWLPKIVAGWAALLLALDGYLLFIGNADKSRGGFSMLATKSERDFLRGDDRDRYDALKWADENAPEGRFEASGFHGKYILAHTGRGFEAHDGDPVALIAPVASEPEGWTLWQEFGTYGVFKR
jgi:hypothetical protein